VRSGKHIEYEPAESRVLCQRQPGGQFSLTVTARGGGVSVTLAAGSLEV
jgi:hypothetical protein